MKCSVCGDNGIAFYRKYVFLFKLNVSCSNCGCQFTLSKVFQLLLYLTVNFSILVVIALGFYQGLPSLYYYVVLGVLFCCVVAFVLPIKFDDSDYFNEHRRKVYLKQVSAKNT